MKRCDESKPYIFISYSHRDSEKVVEIINNLRDRGYNVWYDEGIDPGTEWDENIADHVQNCSYFIAFVSNNYIGSKNCKDELNYSRDLDKDQLLVYLENVDLPGGMAMRMNRIQAIFWGNYEDEEEAYRKLFTAKGIDVTKIVASEGENLDTTSEVNTEVESEAASVASSATATPAQSAPAPAANAVKAKKEEPKVQEAKSEETTEKPKKKFPVWIIPVAVALIAAIGVGIFFILGKGLSKEMKEAIAYLHGAEDTKYNPEKALELFKAEAEKGDMDAAFLAGYTLSAEFWGTVNANGEEAIKYFEMCKDENPYALYGEALVYLNGQDVVKDKDKAYELCDTADKKVDLAVLEEGKLSYAAEAMYYYGWSHEIGDDKDYGETKKWMEKSIELGNVNAYTTLANLYKNGNGVSKNVSTALDYFLKAADKGNGYALNNVGIIYAEGDADHDLDIDMDKAVEYYEKAYEAGNYYGARNIGNNYKNGKITGEKDYEKALEWYEKATELNDNVSMKNIADIYYNGNGDIEQDYVKALEWYMTAADAGNADAYFQIGYIYSNGYGMDEPDASTAIKYYELAAENGSGAALNNLGVKYENGDGVEQDNEKALDYYKKAVEADSTTAMRNLGYKYRDGKLGLQVDIDKAVEYFGMAADKDDVVGTRNLGELYYYSNYNNVDYEKAVEYFKKAAEDNDGWSIYYLAKCYYNGWGVQKDINKVNDYLNTLSGMNNLGTSLEDKIGELQLDIKLSDMTETELDDYRKECQTNKDYKGAWAAVQKLYSKSSNGWAAYCIGVAYTGGSYVNEGIITKDYDKAKSYLETSVKKYENSINQVLPFNALGDLYSNLEYSGYNADTAISYYQKTLDLLADKDETDWVKAGKDYAQKGIDNLK